MKRFMACFAVMLTVLTAGARAEAVPESQSETLVTVEIRGFNGLADSVQRLGGSLMIPVQKEQLATQLSFFLMTTNLTGLNPDGLIRLYVLADRSSPTSAPAIVLGLPIKDGGEEYLDLVAERMEQTDSIRGVEYYKPSTSAAMPSPWTKLCLRVAGNHVLMAQTPEPVELVSQWIDAGAIQQDERLPVEGDLAMAVNVKQAVELFNPLIEEKLETIKKLADRQAKDQPQDVGEILAVEQRLFTTLLRQVDRYLVGMGTRPEWMEFNFRLDAAPNSTLEKMIGSLRQPAPAFQKFLPADALYAQAGNWGDMNLWLEPYMQFVSELYAAMGPGMDQLSSVMQEKVKAMSGQYSGDVAIAVLPPTAEHPFQLIEMIGLRDSSAMKDVMNQLLAAMNQAMTNMPAGMSFEFIPGPAREHDGVAIESYEYRTTWPDEVAKDMPPLLRRLFENMKMELAYVDQAVIYTMGPSELMNESLDRFKAGSGLDVKDSASFKAVYADGMPADLVDAYYANLLDTLRSMLALSPRFQSLQQMIPPSKGTVAGFEQVDGRAVKGRMRVALSDIGGLLQSFMAIQSKLKTKAPPAVLPSEEPKME